MPHSALDGFERSQAERRSMIAPLTVAAFLPHRLLPGGHLQTLAAVLWPSGRRPYTAIQRQVAVSEGDRLVLHDDCPPGWPGEGRAALLLHGLAGCHGSPYMRRIAAKLFARGVRVFRLDLRGAGAGLTLARYPYHAGRSDDLRAAVLAVAELCPQAPLAVVGFSLGGNIALKLAGELGERPLGNLDRVMAISPPVDLAACVEGLRAPLNRWYDRYFVGVLWRQMRKRRRQAPEATWPMWPRRPRGLLELDQWYTAPVSGFGTAANYYAQCSALRFLGAIRLPTLILSARNDPLVASAPLEGATLPPAVRRLITAGGGHLGFLARPGSDPDVRWMDWRVVEWVTAERI
jgi:predicted alpha/beta-fold hydrolase